MDSDSESKTIVLLALRQRLKRKRRYWVHPLNLLRPSLGEHIKLELMYSKHPVQFFEYTRLQPSQFDHVLNSIEGLITRGHSNFRDSIQPRVILFVTLRSVFADYDISTWRQVIIYCFLFRYLGTGDSIRTIATSFSLGRSTVWKIIRETTRHMWTALSRDNLKVSNHNMHISHV
jgi:hypothetical protein